MEAAGACPPADILDILQGPNPIPLLEPLFKQGQLDPNTHFGYQGNPLWVAAGESQSLVDYLLDKGADLNRDTRQTALRRCVVYHLDDGNEENPQLLEMAAFLLDRGADPNHAASELLIAAVRRGDVKMARLLLERGATASVNSRESETFANYETIEFGLGAPLHVAAGAGDQSYDVEAADEVGLTQLLLDGGADPELQDVKGRTALEVAKLMEKGHLVELLSKKGSVEGP